MSDLASLITKAKSGQLDALAALIEAMARDLRAFIATYAASQEMADEVHTATWIQVRKELSNCPPNSQGFVMLEALNILEGMNVRHMRHNSAAYLHSVAEALKLSFADRNRYVADPKFVSPIPMRELLSKEFAAKRRAMIDPDKAIEGEPPPGAVAGPTTSARYASPQAVPPLDPTFVEDGHTTYLAVVDKDHNMVSITSSLLSTFGSGHIAEGAGFFLNNRMAYFSLEPDDVNVLKPGKRPRHTINPAMALKDGKPYIVFGMPGADTQPQAQLQFFLNVVEFGMNVQQAVEAANINSYQMRSSFDDHKSEPGRLTLNESVPEWVRQELRTMGYRLDFQRLTSGPINAIFFDVKNGSMWGGASNHGEDYGIAW